MSNSIRTVSAVSCPSYGVTLLAVTRRWGDKTARATGRQGGSQLIELRGSVHVLERRDEMKESKRNMQTILKLARFDEYVKKIYFQNTLDG